MPFESETGARDVSTAPATATAVPTTAAPVAAPALPRGLLQRKLARRRVQRKMDGFKPNPYEPQSEELPDKTILKVSPTVATVVESPHELDNQTAEGLVRVLQEMATAYKDF